MALSTNAVGVDVVTSCLLEFLVGGVAELVAENGEHCAFVYDPEASNHPAESRLIVALVGVGLFNRLHEDGLKDSACGRRCDDGVAHPLDVELRPGEAGEGTF